MSGRFVVGWSLTSQQHASESQGQVWLGWFVACLTSQQHASVSQGQVWLGLLVA